MLASQLIFSTYPSIDIEDSAGFAIQLMEDYDVQHLPVVNDNKFAGLVSKDNLLDIDENTPISGSHIELDKSSVSAKDHFLTAVKLCNEHSLTAIPVVNEQQELKGLITLQDLLRAVALYHSVEEEGGLIVLEMDKRNYSFGEISRLVETNDAHIVQLNTYVEAETGMFMVALKINKFEVSDVVSTFQRYEYNIKYYFGEELYENELKENFDLLMNYLKM